MQTRDYFGFALSFPRQDFIQDVYIIFVSGLHIERFCMTGGQSPIGYLKAYMTNIYLSNDSEKVREAINEGKQWWR